MHPTPDGARRYRLLGPDGRAYERDTPGVLGGNARGRLYGTLACASAARALARGGYARHRVFFASREDAIAAGYRPCHTCLPDEYREWKAGPREGRAYPWRVLPPPSQTPNTR